jgi:ABC-type transport system substrate-binding protein
MQDDLIRTQRSDRFESILVSRRALLGWGLGAAAMTALAACTSSSSSSKSSATGSGGPKAAKGTITWAWQQPLTWDPVTNPSGSDSPMLALVYDSLTILDEQGQAVGFLAEKWTSNADGTQVTFTLRPNLKFSDGSALDANAVALALNRNRTAKNSVLAAPLAAIKNVTAQGPTDVVMDLTSTNYQVPLILADKPGMIVNPKAFATPAAEAALATQPAGSGPFTVTKYVPNDHADMVKNPNFFLADEIAVAQFKLYAQPDPAVAVAAATSGQYNIVRLTPSSVQAADAAGLEVQTIKSLYTYLITFNTAKPPFDNPAVIEAMNYGIDRARLAEVAQFGIGERSVQPFPQGYIAYNDSIASMFPYDTAKAKDVLAQAGLSGGVDATFTAPTPLSNYPHVELIQAQLKEIGINIKIEALPVAQFAQVALTERARGMVFTTIFGRTSPVSTFQTLGTKTGFQNISGLEDPELLSKLTEISSTPTDDSSYAQLLQDATKLIVTKYPYVFLCTNPFIIARKKSVSELKWFPGSYRFENVSV